MACCLQPQQVPREQQGRHTLKATAVRGLQPHQHALQVLVPAPLRCRPANTSTTLSSSSSRWSWCWAAPLSTANQR
jgi:hypothetical protein